MGTLKGRRVLVVEDSWLLASAVSAWLTGEGLEVVGPASTMESGRDMASREPLDFAIVDFNLGGESALPIIDTLCARDVSVIVLSGYADPCPVGGRIVAVLQKPCLGQKLIEVMKAASPGSAPQTPTGAGE